MQYINGVELCFLAAPCSIRNPPAVLHWVIEQDRSAFSLLRVQMAVLIRVAADVHKMETKAFRRAGVLAPGGDELEMAWLIVGEV